MSGSEIEDTVPAEFRIVDAIPSNLSDGVIVAQANKGQKANKSSGKIDWRPADTTSGSVSRLTVEVETRGRPSKKALKFAPTSCGMLCLNDGAEVYEIDPATGEPLVDPLTGERFPRLAFTEALCLAAVADVNGDGVIAYDGSGDEDGDNLTDGEEVFTYGTSPCLADTDGDSFDDDEEILIIGSDPLDPCDPIPCPAP